VDWQLATTHWFYTILRGCFNTVPFTITEPAVLTASVINPSACGTPSASINGGTGPYQLTSSHSSSVLAGTVYLPGTGPIAVLIIRYSLMILLSQAILAIRSPGISGELYFARDRC
jgi:hypothetical protein